MSEFTQLIVGMVENAGGSTTYPALYEALPAQDRYQLPGAIREAKKAGVLKQEVLHDETTGVNTHRVWKV